MTFSDLYSTALNTELASSDTTQLFTTARRKAAINDAMLAFVRETGCTKRYGTISIVDGTGEYNLLTSLTDYLRLAGDVSIKIVTSSDTRYLQGRDDFPQKSPEQLDDEMPGWRGTDAGIPAAWYLRPDGSALYLGATPAPDVGSGETWSWVVPYVARPTTLSADGDTPFTISSTAIANLDVYHQALAHYAAAKLEPLRKNYEAVKYQMSIYASYVNRYKGDMGDQHAGQITLQRNWFNTRSAARSEDWRR